MGAVEWYSLLEEQGGCCSLCKSSPTEVDHCHETGAVRGLLCHTCNCKVGWAESNKGSGPTQEEEDYILGEI